MPSLRRTKILATLGPATDEDDILEKTLAAGVDVVRLNFSHGTAQDHRKRVMAVRENAKTLGIEVGILADLQGPKIRIAKFKDKKIFLDEGQDFILNASLDENCGDNSQVGIDYKALVDDVKNNDTLLLDDGRIVLKVKKVEAQKIHCIVVVGVTYQIIKALIGRGAVCQQKH